MFLTNNPIPHVISSVLQEPGQCGHGCEMCEQLLHYLEREACCLLRASGRAGPARGHLRHLLVLGWDEWVGLWGHRYTSPDNVNISREARARALALLGARISRASWLGSHSHCLIRTELPWAIRQALERPLLETAVEWSGITDSFGRHFWLLERGGKSVVGEQGGWALAPSFGPVDGLATNEIK